MEVAKLLDKKRKLGKKIKDLQVGDTYTTSYTMDDKELMLYLGLTNDANPLYIQHDYASQTPYQRPLVPSVMLFGTVSSIASMYLPGPGSHIVKQDIEYPKPVYHYSEVKFILEITAVNFDDHLVDISVIGYDSDGAKVMIGSLKVCPAYEPKSMTASSLENFY